MKDKSNIAANSNISMSYGKNDSIHDYSNEIKLTKLSNFGGFSNMGTKRIDSVNNRYSEMQPMNNLGMSVKQIAAQSQMDRFRNSY
jgi:hypothetical protein